MGIDQRIETAIFPCGDGSKFQFFLYNLISLCLSPVTIKFDLILHFYK